MQAIEPAHTAGVRMMRTEVLPTQAAGAAGGALPSSDGRSRSGRRARTHTHVFTAAILGGLVHAVDDALLHRQPGVPVDQHLPVLVVSLAVGAAAVLAFPRLRAGLQSALAVVLGAVTAVNGGTHVLNTVDGGLDASDATGFIAAAAGAVLLLLGAVIPYRRRGEGGRPRWRRWTTRVAVTVTAVVLSQYVLVPVCVALVQTHMPREEIADVPDGYREVSFPSSDGLELSGWYRPSRNRAAVLLVNSAGGDRNGSVAHARLLAEHGYGVLLYDARGTGSSQGTPNGWGWDWDRDVAGALAFLRARDDVDAKRIGALGLSTGADVLIEVTAERGGLSAVVADGATGRSFGDLPPDISAWEAPAFWPMFAAGRLFSGTAPGRPLVELMAEVAPTPLLLVAGGSIPSELAHNRVYAEAGGRTVQLWGLPDVAHNAAIRERPAEYERRVVGLFDTHLLAGGGAP